MAINKRAITSNFIFLSVNAKYMKTYILFIVVVENDVVFIHITI